MSPGFSPSTRITREDRRSTRGSVSSTSELNAIENQPRPHTTPFATSLTNSLRWNSMARFEKERDPGEIQEKLAFSINNSMSLGAGYAQSNPVHGGDVGRSKDRYQPYFPSGSGTSNKGMSWKENGDEGKNKVFVANLAFTVTQHDLQEHLERGNGRRGRWSSPFASS